MNLTHDWVVRTNTHKWRMESFIWPSKWRSKVTLLFQCGHFVICCGRRIPYSQTTYLRVLSDLFDWMEGKYLVLFSFCWLLWRSFLIDFSEFIRSFQPCTFFSMCSLNMSLYQSSSNISVLLHRIPLELNRRLDKYRTRNVHSSAVTSSWSQNFKVMKQTSVIVGGFSLTQAANIGEYTLVRNSPWLFLSLDGKLSFRFEWRPLTY